MGDTRPGPVGHPARESSSDEPYLALLNAHQGVIRRISSTYATGVVDRQDLLQEIVYQLWRSYPNYRRESSPITWLYRVSLNTALTAAWARTAADTRAPGGGS
jgi:DNA-directed RNA polymerase specialized sigma24 family protein